ncbi:hypothetical protein ABEB36_006285 [Hypothenemus hampei]|uniref:Uncharacterized protein n=1 Tax=Hypothenemus hampei TaxID=57062 RepID=A0ABD1EQP8_HYPHA
MTDVVSHIIRLQFEQLAKLVDTDNQFQSADNPTLPLFLFDHGTVATNIPLINLDNPVLPIQLAKARLRLIHAFLQILSYYQFLGAQVTFTETKIVFAIHVLLLTPQSLAYYRVYPIIQNQMLIIPKYPYLVQDETNRIRQYTEEVCPLIENNYFYQQKFDSNDECIE